MSIQAFKFIVDNRHPNLEIGKDWWFEDSGSGPFLAKWPDGLEIPTESEVDAKAAELHLKAARDAWKVSRAEAVAAIKVTTFSGNEFDGDEVSQGRMARAVSSMDDVDEAVWVLANNNPIMATKAELKEALKLAGAAQAAIWVQQ